MDTKKSKVSSIIISNVLIEMLDDVIESEIDKGEMLADFPYVDLMFEISDLLALYNEMTEKRLQSALPRLCFSGAVSLCF